METLTQQFIKAFGWSILNSLWQSALIYGVLFIILLSVPKMAARYKHNLAFGSIVLMFIGFVYNFLSKITFNTPKEAISSNVEAVQFYQYFNNVPPSFSSKAEQYFPMVAAFYIIGIFLQLFVISKGYHQLARFKKDSLSAIPVNWRIIFDEVTLKLQINKAVKFQLSSIVNVPLVIGYLKPVVLFPVALVNQLDNDQVEAILIHELSHIRRNDYLLNLIKTGIETLLFYNPFVWMAGRFIHIEREHACDDLVLKLTGKPLNYAHALLKLELLKDKSSPAYALAATGKTQNLYQRIKRITNMKTNYLNVKQQMAALTLGIACLFSIAWINPATTKKTNKPMVRQQMVAISHDQENLKTVVCLHTTKKRKIKIVTIDANGKKTEYNSVNEMPDSLRRDFYKDEVFSGNRVFRMNIDSGFRFKDSLFQAKIYKKFNSAEAQAKWKKFGEDVAKQYNSPEAQAKWKKFGEDTAKEYNSPEAQAKWKKMASDAITRVNLEGFQMNLDSNTKVSMSEYLGLALKELKTPEWKTELAELSKQKGNKNYYKSQRDLSQNFQKKLKEKYGEPYLGNSTPLRISIDKNDKVKNSREYQKLKQKFDNEVKELKEKMEKAERKERKEN